MTKLSIMPGPAFCAASAVSTKMPVPMMAPMPSMVSWNGAQRAVQRLLLGRAQNGVERLYPVEQHERLPLCSPRAAGRFANACPAALFRHTRLASASDRHGWTVIPLAFRNCAAQSLCYPRTMPNNEASMGLTTPLQPLSFCALCDMAADFSGTEGACVSRDSSNRGLGSCGRTEGRNDRCACGGSACGRPNTQPIERAGR